VNRENMLKVADAIENETVRFNMAVWIGHQTDHEYGDVTGFTSGQKDTCGTACCIGGTADLLRNREMIASGGYSFHGFGWRDIISDSKAAEWLGLSLDEANTLFIANEYRTGVSYSSNETAYGYINERRHLVPNALRWMAESGEVSWKKGFEYAECLVKERELEQA
jgi:hypothetical protein